MNVKVLSPVFDGIRDSFKLSAGIVLAVGSVISSFANHSLSLQSGNAGNMRNDVVPHHKVTKGDPTS
jgi:hypothetical protein